LVVAAHVHAAMADRIQKDMHLAAPVAAEDARLLPHTGSGEIARVGDLALVTDEQPGPCEEPLQFRVIDRVADEDLAAEPAGLQIDHAGPIILAHGYGHGPPHDGYCRPQPPARTARDRGRTPPNAAP